jgi:hypothetical protein
MLAASAARLAMIISHFRTVQGNSEVTAKTSAANGGYVNLISGRSCHEYSCCGAPRTRSPAWLYTARSNQVSRWCSDVTATNAASDRAQAAAAVGSCQLRCPGSGRPPLAWSVSGPASTIGLRPLSSRAVAPDYRAGLAPPRSSTVAGRLCDRPENGMDVGNIGDPRRIDRKRQPGLAGGDAEKDQRFQSARQGQAPEEPRAVGSASNRKEQD